jgi:xanthine dehydrogenase molybdenum-binding subunit
LDLPEESVRIISSAIGGGFGVKVAGRYAVLCALLARKTGRPVKIWFTREEETIDSHNRPSLVHYVKAGAKRDGSLTAFQIRTYLESGHWLGKSATRLAEGMIHHVMDLYHPCPNVLWEVFVARTNHPAGGPVRGRSDMESHFAVDCVVDELAHGIGMDPLEFRLKNRIREGDPMCASPGKVVSSVGVEEAVRKGAEAIGWERRRQKPDSGPEPKKKGIGMAMVIHSAGGQPFRTAAGRVEVHDDGRILFFCGTADQGAEQQTTLRQMVAEILGVSIEKIGGVNADTALCPRDTGPISSRTVYSTGRAACRAAEAMKKTLLDLASRSLEVSADDLELRDGSVRVRGVPSKSLSFARIAELNGAPIVESGEFNGKNEPTIPWGFAATFVEVEVDTETGELNIVKLVSSHDAGRVIHPAIVRGQIEGGASWGLGHALAEGFCFDERTGTTLNQWFLDLKTPSTLDTPAIEPVIIEKEEPTHPFGAKGCSEISIIGVAPAIANAIYNATGVRMTEIPLTPDRVLAAIRAQKGQSR